MKTEPVPDEHGRFDLGPFPEDPRAGLGEEEKVPAWADEVTFASDAHASLSLQASSVPPADRDRLVLLIERAGGRPEIFRAAIDVRTGGDSRLRRVVREHDVHAAGIDTAAVFHRPAGVDEAGADLAFRNHVA